MTRPGRVLGLILAAAGIVPADGAQPWSWEQGAGFRSAPLSLSATGKTGFSPMPPTVTGIVFTNQLAVERYTTNQIYLNGSGVAAGDVDGDGWCDLYFCGIDNQNVLYRNLGNWKFEDITAAAGVACANLDATGAAFADLDGDGDLDLVVNSVATGTEIFFNDGTGHFTKVATLNPDHAGMSLALADIDGDGDLDLYVANYRTWTIRDRPNTKFRVNPAGTNFVVVRVNDRPVSEPDLVGRFVLDPGGKIIENGEPDVLFRNDGGGKFTPLSFTDGTFLDEDGKPLTSPPYDWGLSVMFRDLNGDGAPDIYVCNDFASPDRIWINDGHGRFRALGGVALRNTSLFSMGIDFADLNRDGLDEFFVADMLSRSHRLRQVQVGDLPPVTLAVGRIDDRPQYSHNTLFFNRGDGTYAELAQFAGVDASEWSWTPVFMDVDLDGYEDILISTGHERDAMNADVINRAEELKAQRPLSIMEQLNLRRMFSRLDAPNVAFRNRGNLTFDDVSATWGFDARGVSHGMAVADLDNDGDLDVVMNNLNRAPGIYRNDGVAPRIAVRLKGAPPNTRGIGARLKVMDGPVPMQSQEMICGGRYLSSDDAVRVFAAGSPTNILRIEVAWRSGKHSIVTGAKPNRVYEIDESSATSSPTNLPSLTATPEPFFKDVSGLIAHTHHEEAFDDFARQTLLPRRLSQLGPGVAWFDVDGDGWEDLIVASGRGGQLSVFHNDGKGGFNPMHDVPLAQPVTRDQTTVLGWSKGAGQTVLLAGSANYEDGLAVGAAVRQYNLAAKTMDDRLPGQESSAGPLALADIDGDGDLDLFVGGRSIPGKYPEAASSMLFRDAGGRWELDTENTKRLARIGLVSGAVWSDLDGDGFPELILACDWGPIKIFRNDHGTLTAWNPEIRERGTRNPELGTLSRLSGWWNGVTTGDLDGDGRPDIIASNWGWNNIYQARRGGMNPPPAPAQDGTAGTDLRSSPPGRGQGWVARVFFGDLAGNGSTELIEAYADEATSKIVPFHTLASVGKALPFVREHFPTFAAYSTASVSEILGERAKTAKELAVTTLASTVFLNRGGRFEVIPLPAEAQWTPAFGISVGDLDGDGSEDVFLSQNFFAVPSDTWRHDAGRGLWLKGDGHGGLLPLAGQLSGVTVYGEQRGCALSDYDGDGRLDLAVTQNGAPTKLYRNVGARPGLRVRLNGPPGNPTGVGALVRLVFGQKQGPAREIHAGSGYWSQDGAVQVMAAPQNPTGITVRWPGGKVTTTELPGSAHEIEVNQDGKVKVLH
jgi:hypothetical protein